MTQCLDLSLRGHCPHASYELTGQCLLKQVTSFKAEDAACELPLRHTIAGNSLCNTLDKKNLKMLLGQFEYEHVANYTKMQSIASKCR